MQDQCTAVQTPRRPVCQSTNTMKDFVPLPFPDDAACLTGHGVMQPCQLEFLLSVDRLDHPGSMGWFPKLSVSSRTPAKSPRWPPSLYCQVSRPSRSPPFGIQESLQVQGDDKECVRVPERFIEDQTFGLVAISPSPRVARCAWCPSQRLSLANSPLFRVKVRREVNSDTARGFASVTSVQQPMQ